MKNKELFTLNPVENNLLNDGVVEVNTARDADGLKVIRHELRTFVCEGEYQSGFQRILSTYLKHIDQPKQPAVWVSGFFGSGKSHLVKMLSYLWEDFKFPDGETARSIKALPQDVNDLLVELDRRQKSIGRLAVIGTLKDFPADDIRYSFLQLVLNALGLPSQYHHFKFVHWLMQEGLYEDVEALVNAQEKDFKKECKKLYVSSALHKAILQVRPDFAESEAKIKEIFKAQFVSPSKISHQQLIETIRDEALPLFFKKGIPCTIIVLDEVQQFIGGDGNRTNDIQHLAEAVCSNFEGKFLLVGTGQNSLSETPFLQPLQERFTVKVTLSDSDVETVTRKTVLEKKPSVVGQIDAKIESVLGEIQRNMSGTTFGYLVSDRPTLVADYPMMPSTRKLWKKILQVIDTAGTSGQLRSLLRIVDESIKRVADEELGSIIPADFIFEQKQQQLLQNALLLNETNNLIETRKSHGEDGVLESRILACVFLIDQLPQDLAGGRLKSDANTIADLLITNLNKASDGFRRKVKEAIASLVEEKLLMPIDDEFKLQTKVGAAWEKEYTSHAVKIGNSGDDQIHQLRRERILRFFNDKTKTISILHGVSKLKREFEIWGQSERPNTDTRLHVWIRDGWFENDTIVLNEIRAEGNDAPLAYAFVEKIRDSELRSEIVKYLASNLTLQSMGMPTSPEGEQAQKAMETRKGLASIAIDDLIEKVCREATVYLAGGVPVAAGSIRDNIEDALNSIADRQFSKFKNVGDEKDWDKAWTSAFGGDPDALKKIGWTGEPKDHPVAIEVMRFLGNNQRQGKDFRSHFMKSPYGWSQDAVDTVLLLLRNTEHISTPEPNLNHSTIANATFKREVHTLTAKNKIDLRKLYQMAGVSCKPNEEFLHSNTFLNALMELAGEISGDAPRPEPIDTQFLKDIQNLDGNERLLRLLEEQEDLKSKWHDWKEKSKLVTERLPLWELLSSLVEFAPASPDLEALTEEIEAISTDRLLFHTPDLVAPKLDLLVEKLKNALNALKGRYISVYDQKMETLQSSADFIALTPDQKHQILAKNQLLTKPEIKPLDAHGLLNQLRQTSLPLWETKIAALQTQFQYALDEAIQITRPMAETVLLERKTLSSVEEIEEYLTSLRTKLENLVSSGKTVILK
jgi:hypothetical protein